MMKLVMIVETDEYVWESYREATEPIQDEIRGD